jgi:peptide chain release factor 1
MLLAALCANASAFAPSLTVTGRCNQRTPALSRASTSLTMVLDTAMKSRLDGIRRSYLSLTERLGDPDVIADSNLLRQVMKDRSMSEEVVMAFNEVSTSRLLALLESTLIISDYCPDFLRHWFLLCANIVVNTMQYTRLEEELEGAQELFEASDDAEMREMARSEIKDIQEKMEELERQIKILLLPKDPNDDRNCMLEIRAGTGGSEANIFAGEIQQLQNLCPK